VTKNLIIIIPGAGSSELNWLDQLIYFKELGHEVVFCDYHGFIQSTFDQTAIKLLEKISEILAEHSDLKTDTKVNLICHSMGGMLMLYLLAQLNRLQDKYPEVIKVLKNSNIALVQVPLSKQDSIISTLAKVHAPAKKMFSLYQSVFKGSVRRVLTKAKYSFLKDPQTGLIKSSSNFIWMMLAMHDSCWSTNTETIDKLIDFYYNWDESLLESLSEQFKNSDIKPNIYITSCNTDKFCPSAEVLDFADNLEAQHKCFNWTFHNPMHFPWSQAKFNSWLMREVIS
jgi:pimeloyl-ACP methyl ester carboxylesterase